MTAPPPLTLDIVIDERPTGVFAYLFGHDSVAAAADSVDQALDRMDRLVKKLAPAQPGLFADSTGQPRPTSRRLEVSVSVADGMQIRQLDLDLVAALRRVETDVSTHWKVFLPEVSLTFDVSDRNQLRSVSRERIGDTYPLDERLAALAPFAGAGPGGSEQADAHVSDTQLADANLDVRRIEVLMPRPPTDAANTADAPILEAVGEPLHRRLDRKDAPRAFERHAQVDALLDALADPRGRGVLLVGPPGVGKSTVVYDAVGRMLGGDGPLMGSSNSDPAELRVWKISGSRLMADTQVAGHWQTRVIEVIDEARRTGAILVADNLVELLEATGNDTGGIAELLLPHIATGELVFVTEARPDQLAYVEQAHPGFLHALGRLPVEPMSPAATDGVLERVSFRLGRQHGVRLSKPARQRIIELCTRFSDNAALPGPAVDLAERMARAYQTRPDQTRSNQPSDADRALLEPAQAIDAFAARTGLPAELLDTDADFAVADVRQFFEHHVFDQPEATRAMVDLVSVIRTGLNPPGKPFGSYLFLGPTGVGKTQTALVLADYLFGSHRRLVRLDMSEYQDARAAARLVGRRQGEPGELVRRLQEQPFGVVLFDEIEKAHPSVFDLLLQITGDGRITDALGQTAALAGSVIVMTSNLGTSDADSLGFGATDTAHAQRRDHLMGEVEAFFRPEFIGRLDRIIAFRALGKPTARKLVERSLDDTVGRPGLSRRNIRINTPTEVIDYLIDTGFDPRYGARPLQQAVENHITAPLAQRLAEDADLHDIVLGFEMADGTPQVDIQAHE